VLFIVLVQMQFIQRAQFNETNVTSHAFQHISDIKVFPECFCRPVITLWRVICGPQTYSWTTLD